MGLPLDVWFEVLANLTPYDLLKLARTTKDFRKILMVRSAAPVWARARKNVPGLPPCPADMTEPAYANLAFSPCCHFCLTRTSRRIDWDLRARMCATCIKQEVISVRRGNDPIPRLIPTQISTRSSRPLSLCLKRQYDEMGLTLHKLGEDQIQAFEQDRRQVVQAHKEHTELCERWSQNQANSRVQELYQLKKDRYDSIIHKLTELGWGEELKQIRAQDFLSNHRLVKQPHKLTDRIWKNIKTPLVESMESMRIKRLELEREKLIKKRKLAVIDFFRGYKNYRLPYAELMPEPADYLAFEPIHTLIEKPDDEELKRDTWVEFEPCLPDLIRQWREKVEEDLIACVRLSITTKHRSCRDSSTCSHQRHLDLGDNGIRQLMKLVTTAYRCQSCTKNDSGAMEYWDEGGFNLLSGQRSGGTETKILYYPEILGRHCLTRRLPSTTSEMRLAVFGSDTIPRLKLSFHGVVLDEEYGCVVAELAKLAGQAPDTITAADMDRWKHRFYCHKCYKNDNRPSQKGRVTVTYLTWREMAMHIMEYHRGEDADPKLIPRSFVEILSESRVETAIELRRPQRTNQELSIWCCAHCRDSLSERVNFTRNEISLHLDIEHDIVGYTRNMDFYKTFDAISHYPSPFRDFRAGETLVIRGAQVPGDGSEIDWDLMVMQFELDEDDDGTSGCYYYFSEPEPVGVSPFSEEDEH
ncbi:hypothetical protein P691DRAFT_710588 [Macrolepiota fuliginosa MF-IS2]|uniref:F-box domain-containing protein n=1 Tax=Macrolepiota fuliginosa MF-IS2 TaxID=1400762 RepID=A0A9P5X8I3_9AGAR|nr:hypothetical protein P691DRAFT_710588 [Macrolepiota fuliginosa MF-IS2]